MRRKVFLLIWVLNLIIAIVGQGWRGVVFSDSDSEKPSFASMLIMNREFTVDGDAQGYRSMDNIIVYAFSHSEPEDEDPQLYMLQPDISIRSWMQWDKKGTNPKDYNFNFTKKCQDLNIAFIGGGTASVVNSQQIHLATKNAANRTTCISSDSGGCRTPDCYRASLANPKYRQFVVNYCKIQIDGGVDGIFFDEANAGGYMGLPHIKWPKEPEKPHMRYSYWNDTKIAGYMDFNEGFDDYFIADFNRYLMNKYPEYGESDWISRYGMSKENFIKRDVPYNDLKQNFNYRKYLKNNGWVKDPHNPANPLAKEWGRPRINRMASHNYTFMDKYLELYWKEIVVAVRKYAREQYGKEIWVTSNGIFPFVDFNSLGIYPNNDDDDGKEADYIPLFENHLNGAKSLKSVYLKVLKESKEVSGDVPLTVFIDFPNKWTDNYYYKLSRSEKKDFWRIYGAEMYACGLYPAFHLKTTTTGEPTAGDSGVLNFFIEYSRFYKTHKDLYQSAFNTDQIIKINKENIEYNVTYRPKQNSYLVHLINHNYQRKILPQTNFTISFELEGEPTGIKLLTPDGDGQQQVNYLKEQSKLVINVEKIESYNVIIIQM